MPRAGRRRTKVPVPTDRAIGLHQSLAAGLASGQGNLRAVRARRGLHCGGTRRDDRRPSTDRRSDAGRCRNTERTLSAGSDAGVLAMDPELLVLDEPMAGLNHSAQEDLLAVLGELHGRGIALLAGDARDRLHLPLGRPVSLGDGRSLCGFAGRGQAGRRRGMPCRQLGCHSPESSSYSTHLLPAGRSRMRASRERSMNCWPCWPKQI